MRDTSDKGIITSYLYPESVHFEKAWETCFSMEFSYRYYFIPFLYFSLSVLLCNYRLLSDNAKTRQPIQQIT